VLPVAEDLIIVLHADNGVGWSSGDDEPIDQEEGAEAAEAEAEAEAAEPFDEEAEAEAQAKAEEKAVAFWERLRRYWEGRTMPHLVGLGDVQLRHKRLMQRRARETLRRERVYRGACMPPESIQRREWNEAYRWEDPQPPRLRLRRVPVWGSSSSSSGSSSPRGVREFCASFLPSYLLPLGERECLYTFDEHCCICNTVPSTLHNDLQLCASCLTEEREYYCAYKYFAPSRVAAVVRRCTHQLKWYLRGPAYRAQHCWLVERVWADSGHWHWMYNVESFKNLWENLNTRQELIAAFAAEGLDVQAAVATKRHWDRVRESDERTSLEFSDFVYQLNTVLPVVTERRVDQISIRVWDLFDIMHIKYKRRRNLQYVNPFVTAVERLCPLHIPVEHFEEVLLTQLFYPFS
jgi:hypothetical protein